MGYKDGASAHERAGRRAWSRPRPRTPPTEASGGVAARLVGEAPRTFAGVVSQQDAVRIAANELGEGTDDSRVIAHCDVDAFYSQVRSQCRAPHMCVYGGEA